MKQAFIFVCIVLISIQSNAQFSKANLIAGGLTCSMCSKSIHKALSKVSFVEKVITDIKTTSYNIQFKDTVINPDALRKAVEDAGFTVLSLVLSAKLENVNIKHDTHIILQHKVFHFLQTEAGLINDTVQLRILDKNFVSDKEHKTLQASTTLPCYETGKMSSCCPADEMKAGDRVFHVTIVK